MNNGFFSRATLWWCALGLALAGCRPASEDTAESNGLLFKTPWQTETEYVVHTIARDLAEELSLLASGKAPPPGGIKVTTVERQSSTQDVPAFAVTVELPGMPPIRHSLTVNGMLWAPEVYLGLAGELRNLLKVKTGTGDGGGSTDLVTRLVNGSPETIEKENQRISEALRKDFGNPDLHEEAALLYGFFLLRDFSDKFFDIRAPLTRLTTHLAMARCLRTGRPGLNGLLAEAALNTLVGNQTAALKLLDQTVTRDGAGAFARGLRARATGDYRELESVTQLTKFEQFAHYYARAGYAELREAWNDLPQRRKQDIDYLRITSWLGAGVEIGHELLAEMIPAEMEEIETIYQLAHGKGLKRTKVAEALNVTPEGIFDAALPGHPLRVIGWGQWASFLQRHLCHAIYQNYDFLRYWWGVPEYAEQFAREQEKQFSGLRFYPFIRRFTATEEQAYRSALADAFKITFAAPHLIPAGSWERLSVVPKFAPRLSIPNPRTSEWHKHNPPPGTTYDLSPRLYHVSLVGRQDYQAKFEQLLSYAPCDMRIASFLECRCLTNQPPQEVAMRLYGPAAAYCPFAMNRIAHGFEDQPEEFEKRMREAAKVNPRYYYALAKHAICDTQEDIAAVYYDLAAENDRDAVRVSNLAWWRVDYWVRKGDLKKAREIAEHGADVYSCNGLRGAAWFYEQTTNYARAFEFYQKNEERYDHPADVVDFCIRYKLARDDGRFDAELEKRIKTLFPRGLRRVTLQDFQSPPTNGVAFASDSPALKSAGMKVGDVVVAVHGIQVANSSQYIYAREREKTPEMPLIVWQGEAYREFRPNLPSRRFGVQTLNFRPKGKAASESAK